MENITNMNEMMRQPVVNQNYRNSGLVKHENMPEMSRNYFDAGNQFDRQTPFNNQSAFELGICYVPMQEWDGVK